MTRVTDLVNVEDIIISNDITIIPAQVGAGKTRFIAVELPKHGNVLFLCALKSIAEQTKKEYGTKKLDIYTFEGFRRKFIINETIEELNEIGKSFDFIVIDEAHDLVQFDGFMEAVFPVRELMLRNRAKTILLTATPQIIKSAYGSEIFNELEEVKLIETEAKPKKVILVNNKDYIKGELLKCNKKNKGIYFSERADNALRLEAELNKLGAKAVAIVGESKEKGKNAMQEPHRAKALKEINRGIFPKGYNLVITTTKLREGVNFIDENIKLLATELMDLVNLIQISGRVRLGVDIMIGFIGKSVEHEDAREFNTKKQLISSEVEKLNDLYRDTKSKELKGIILSGVNHNRKYARYNCYKDSIEYNVENHTKRLFDLLSKQRLKANPIEYVKKLLNVEDVELKEIDNKEHKINKINNLMVEYTGKLYIYGNDKKIMLKDILVINSTQKIKEELKKLGFVFNVLGEKRFNGEKYYTVYEFDF